MSRPEARYFDPVIAKIQALKKQEQIVVDNAFKAHLRTNILSKIEAMGPVQVGPTSFLDKLLKWRYQLAVVPTLLLLMVVVFSLKDLPISFKSEKFVPVAPPSNAPSRVGTTSSPSSTVEGDREQPSDIKTFSGYEVLPLRFFENDFSSPQGKTSTYQDASKPTSVTPKVTKNLNQSNGVSLPPESSIGPQKINPPSPQMEPQKPLQNVVNPPTVDFSPLPSSDPAVNLAPEGVSPQNTTNPLPPASTPVTVQNPPPTPSQTAPLPPAPLPPPAPTPLVEETLTPPPPTTDTAPIILAPDLQSDRVTVPPPAPNAPLLRSPAYSILPVTPKYNVYFNGDFTDSEKSFFESVIPTLQRDKAIAYATVSFKETNIVIIYLNFVDKSEASYTYFLDPKTNRWILRK